VFYIACAEFFGLNNGEEYVHPHLIFTFILTADSILRWGVGHYLFKRKD
jgi:hypothetical protein